jgi:CPA2 family monovalent cation:H+ antiporter-2
MPVLLALAPLPAVPAEDLLREAVIVLAAAVAVVFACSRLRIPPVVGLLLTGLAIGPTGLGWIPDPEGVEIFAEVGVVLLLFAIGLELSFGELRELGRPFLLGGSVQWGVTAAATAGVAVLLGQPLTSALAIGFAVGLSSTAVVLKLYADRRETETPQGRAVLGILLFQDFLIVLLIVLVPVLAGEAEASTGELTLRLAGATGAVAAVFLLARFVVPHLFDHLVGTRIRELFILAALATCLGMAWFTHALGFSFALGAFLAGLLVSESDYAHQVIADVEPFRDLFASVFFISIGMLVDLPFALGNLPALLGLAVLLVAGKTLVAALAAALSGFPVRIAVIAGLGLAQIGEFSFVLMEVARGHGLLGEQGFQVLLVSAVFTLAVTPLLIRAAPAVGRRAADRLSRRPEAPLEEAEALSGHVVLVGYGLTGRLVARVLGEARIPFVVLELNPVTVRSAGREGVPIQYGDATRRAILEQAGIERARAIVLAVTDREAVRRSVRLARELHPEIEILVRTRTVQEIDALREAGADQVVAEEFESAIEVYSRVLALFHVPRNVVRAVTRTLRGEGYRMMRSETLPAGASEAILATLEAGTTDLYRVPDPSRGAASPGGPAGKTLRDLDLRRRTGASVIAVVRGEEPRTSPDPTLVLEPGDTLVLVGSHDEIDRAFQHLDHPDHSAPLPP